MQQLTESSVNNHGIFDPKHRLWVLVRTASAKRFQRVSQSMLNLFSASTVNLHGASNSNMFRNNLQIRLSPLKSPILRKYINPFKRPGMYPSISKCNAKKCNCCNHLCSKTTITSSVNGRTFSVVNDSDLD